MNATRSKEYTDAVSRDREPACRLTVPGITRRQLCVAGAALPAVVLAACGPLQREAAAPLTTKQPKKVGFHTDWIEGARGETIKLALEQWAKEHPTDRKTHV